MDTSGALILGSIGSFVALVAGLYRLGRLTFGPVVGAIAAVNAAGDVYDPAAGKLIAGARTPDGKQLLGSMAAMNGLR